MPPGGFAYFAEDCVQMDFFVRALRFGAALTQNGSSAADSVKFEAAARFCGLIKVATGVFC